MRICIIYLESSYDVGTFCFTIQAMYLLVARELGARSFFESDHAYPLHTLSSTCRSR